jgi:hypothetical protein
MKASFDDYQRSTPRVSSVADQSLAERQDPQIARAVEEYRALLKGGSMPDREAFLARYPAIATALAECLDGLEFLHQAGGQLNQPVLEHPARAAAASGQIAPDSLLGDYRIVREIGRGGMGVVYEAEQPSLGRRVALKVLPVEAARDAKLLARFRRESQAAAQLHHSNIVPVFEVGQQAEVVFYAMQYIQGQSLDAVVQDLQRLRAVSGSPAGKPAAPAPSAVARSLLTGVFEPVRSGESTAGAEAQAGEPPPRGMPRLARNSSQSRDLLIAWPLVLTANGWPALFFRRARLRFGMPRRARNSSLSTRALLPIGWLSAQTASVWPLRMTKR